jgi:tetratricopeptide (TPR) repeat protein
MVNSDNGQIIPEIIRAVAKEYQWEDFLPPPLEVVTVDPTRLDAYTGRFLVNPDRVLTITRENDKLYMEPTLSPKVELFAISANEFARTDANLRYTFQADSVQIKSDAETTNAKRIGPDVMIPYEKLQAGKYAEAIAEYQKIKRETPNHNVIAEGRLNSMGYALLSQKKIAASIAVFRLNVEFYPQSANTYDSLGEAYMENGEKEQAIANYKKSLELDPRNNNAVEMLKKLGQR